MLFDRFDHFNLYNNGIFLQYLYSAWIVSISISISAWILYLPKERRNNFSFPYKAWCPDIWTGRITFSCFRHVPRSFVLITPITKSPKTLLTFYKKERFRFFSLLFGLWRSEKNFIFRSMNSRIVMSDPSIWTVYERSLAYIGFLHPKSYFWRKSILLCVADR